MPFRNRFNIITDSIRIVLVQENILKIFSYNVDIEVPEGSIIGSPMFHSFIFNDLPSHIGTETLVLYAHDTSISKEGQSIEELQFKLDEVILNVRKTNLNAEKTALVQFSGRKMIH